MDSNGSADTAACLEITQPMVGALAYRALVPSPSTLPVFVAASLVLLVIPGPAVLFIVARSGAQGRRAGLVSVLGVHTASIVHVLAAVAGVSAVVVASSLAFTAVKVVGGCYLIFLGLKSLRNARTASAASAPKIRATKQLFAEGFLVSLLNPKVALFFLAFLPQFVERGNGPIWSQTLLLGLLYIALGLCSDSMYALLGARLGSRFSGHAARVRATRYAEGGILIGLGVLSLAVPHRRARA
jgi:threonine/homoserine/homoserine lactone efflux protein